MPQFCHHGVKQPPHLLSKLQAVKTPLPNSALCRDPLGYPSWLLLLLLLPIPHPCRDAPPALEVSGGICWGLASVSLQAELQPPGSTRGICAPVGAAPEGVLAPVPCSIILPHPCPSECCDNLGRWQTPKPRAVTSSSPPSTVAACPFLTPPLLHSDSFPRLSIPLLSSLGCALLHLKVSMEQLCGAGSCQRWGSPSQTSFFWDAADPESSCALGIQTANT